MSDVSDPSAAPRGDRLPAVAVQDAGVEPGSMRANRPQPAAREAWLRRAATLRQAPWLHAEVARRMAERLAYIKAEPAVVLDWWALLGGGLPALRKRYPHARIERIEPTDALRRRNLQIARARRWWWPMTWSGEPRLVVREDRLPGEPRAGLLWSNMMLHWSPDPMRTFERWHALLHVGGFVMFSCFGPDTLRELRALYRKRGDPVPAHDFIDMHDLGDALVHAGFADPVMDMERLTLNWADAGAALAELRSLGGNASAARFAGLRTPRWRAHLHADLNALRDAQGRLDLTFEIVYGHAFKPEPRLALRRETRVPLDVLRAQARRRGPAAS